MILLLTDLDLTRAATGLHLTQMNHVDHLNVAPATLHQANLVAVMREDNVWVVMNRYGKTGVMGRVSFYHILDDALNGDIRRAQPWIGRTPPDTYDEDEMQRIRESQDEADAVRDEEER